MTTTEITPEAVARRWYITISELASLTGLSQEVVRKAVYEKELPAIRMRRRWLITPDDARQWITGASSTEPHRYPMRYEDGTERQP